MQKITINPLPRVHPFASVEVALDGKKVADARCTGNFFRGFEIILRGRDPRDAPYLTERVCGICSGTHATAACFALERAAGAHPPQNGNLLRNLLQGADILQNHIRHFYLYALPDYLKGSPLDLRNPGYTRDCRLPEKKNDEISNNYFRAINLSRQADEMGALLGGKTPYPHGFLPGGSSVPPAADILTTFRFKLGTLNDFIRNVYLADVLTLAEYYPDYYEIGVRKPDMLSFGLFPRDAGDRERYFPAGAVIDGRVQPVDTAAITEDITNSWYTGDSPLHPSRERTEPDREKPGAYSFGKAPRYGGTPLEGGPLVRQWLAGDYRKGVSTMDRNIARALEAQKIGRLMEGWLAELAPGEPVYIPPHLPQRATAAGLVDGPRGPLGHWLRIEKGKIGNYEIVTPTAWNFSPRDGAGRPGPVEEALIGTPVEHADEPVEIGRVIRAFDICMACVAHVMLPGRKAREFVIIP